MTCRLQIYRANCPCKLNMNTAIKELQQNNRIQQYKGGEKSSRRRNCICLNGTERNSVQCKITPSLGFTICLFFLSFPAQLFYLLSLFFSPFNSFQFERISQFLLTNATLYIKVFSTLFVALHLFPLVYSVSLDFRRAMIT